jgi:Fe-S cluster assembly protein SufD
MESIETHLRNYRELGAVGPSAQQRLRGSALERFAELGFPTTRLEDWRFTDVSALAGTPFRLAGPASALAPGAIDALRLEGTVELVFVNGRYSPQLSRLEAMQAGVTVGDLAAAIENEQVLARLGKIARPEEGAFAALNTAFVQHGAFVHIARGVATRAPIHCLFVTAAAGEAIITHPRVLIVAEESSEAAVFETYGQVGDGVYCTNAITEIAVGANAGVSHHKLEIEGERAFHIARVAAHQERDSRFGSHAVSVGGALTRSDVETALAGPGASCSLDGLYLTAGTQHTDHHTTIDHREPQCSSRELYKGVLDGRSSAVFNGKVFVRPGAQKTDAGQVNKNLLLSRDATIDTKPQLEIFTDDVKCSHGATIGQLDSDALFFLRARGIDIDEARRLLIYAFANELVDRVRFEPARARLERVLASRMHAIEVPR